MVQTRSNMENENENKTLGGNIAGKLTGVSGMGDVSEIASDFREGKAGAAAMKTAEAGVSAAISATGVGGAALKVARSVGIPIDKIIVYLILIFLILVIFPTILAAGYAITNPTEALYELFKFKTGS
ncbi:MAG: hypothetical protein US83_C0005G0081 [Candidatus Falkowbacteria bacterium GW2011_GWC2_38_22]|uniref:Uncharacterized protein n=1 Tax=Candidatus Falkowbacteria bacterium GW2011_GWE1_38_31 TaxID=1618638 RepID=A0A0G0JRX7_9BACT|nr:MAG: hypothetical protein US73_C0003G0013 [Candidatus Falkowbacteria bacterium GW2011_GWF2_38_1205]KKQ61568.1 MAG: hypothetical protein US83_C0005G0081 [Candidatus Falkowbacteria bacterium GW2011_GWC2_38_22]KKQ63539.1 MAG: hypothetical protein US84_C0005G0013 [Candidatus Falkowbacteria bacterium GW2011_GWF1_38_22]KKQ65691.1 MAG: hypothetical protein US87_C0005G0013 [Candidatus Falkowbacteria bacterium GW2011_GWE2_38_254]KKQ70308.1 MAG: hypothetical protein US91_C0005G0013 [Candidatus Falkowb